MKSTKRIIQSNIYLLEHSAYLHKRFFSVKELEEYHESRISESLNKLVTNNGIACLTPLEWDSKMFGFPVVRVDYLLTDKSKINKAIKDKESLLKIISDKYPDHYIFYRLDTKDISSIYALENSGFNLIDGIETFYYDLGSFKKYDSPNSAVIFREATKHDEKEFGYLGKNLYNFDRFHNDNLIPKYIADKVHSEWLKNSVKGTAANYVAVAEIGGKITSFATCKIVFHTKLNIRLGIIILVGTNKENQGRGFGKEITKYALNWFKEQQADIVQVKTQLANVAAAKTYLESGFKLLNTELTFRKYNKPNYEK